MGRLIVSAQMTMDSVMDHMKAGSTPKASPKKTELRNFAARMRSSSVVRPTKALPHIGRTRKVRTPSSSIRSRNTLPHGRSKSR